MAWSGQNDHCGALLHSSGCFRSYFTSITAEYQLILCHSEVQQSSFPLLRIPVNTALAVKSYTVLERCKLVPDHQEEMLADY